MHALVTTHRGVIMSVVIGPDVDTLKNYIERGLTIPAGGSLRWNNYVSHWGIVTNDGLTSHTIHHTTEVR
jgi:hypothetical protein